MIEDARRSRRALLGNKMTIDTAIKNDQEYEAALEAIE